MKRIEELDILDAGFIPYRIFFGDHHVRQSDTCIAIVLLKKYCIPGMKMKKKQ